MKQSLRLAVDAHYEKESLDDQQLDRLEKMLHDDAQSSRVRPWYKIGGAIAATVMLAIVATVGLYSPKQDMSLLIAQEVATNHIKMRPLEIQSNQMSDLREYFSQIDFSLVDPQRFESGQLLGGRYCSILGVTAAQLRYSAQGSEHNKVTLYEVAYDPTLFGELPDIDKGMQPLKLTDKGLAMEIWVEKGLLMVSAQPQ